jgi:uncharacterized phiE125 gp8 family phage protein
LTLKLITAPAAEPVLLADAKAHLRVTDSTEDALIGILITAAREAAEARTGRRLITQTWELQLDAFPSAEIEIPVQPVASITSVQYVDTAGTLQTLAADQYTLDEETLLSAWVLPADGVTWPATRDVADALRVRFVAGYGAAGTAVPASIRQWMLIAIGSMYSQRESTAGGQLAEVPRDFVHGLLDAYVIHRIG